MTSTAMGWCT